MAITKERIGALFFLLLSIIYGYLASGIKLYPGDELDPMTARTLPLVLSGLGIAFSLILLATGKHEEHRGNVFALNWKPVILLMLLSLGYGFALDWLGFLISTTLFLMAGFRILGEKSVKKIVLVAVPFVFIFWFGLTQMLDIYLASGRIFGGA
ncbi:MAG: tripartite tricarboxylate transporter TctB family protein [Gammaproteobacteria bacterium]|nr:MAG: tripartite tricarboxylate transporter TctB family protein [Gammaproteobacteria bacterium]UCH38644.1 MAG: tripartite tricarboxylate transporter TctB family protein [Gammaproteobacteria bacterium]